MSVTWSFMGSETVTSETTVLGNTGSYTVLDAVATEVMNATANVGTIKKDGVAIDATVMSIEFTIDNSLREQRAVSHKFPAGIGYGRMTLEGTLTLYFQDFTFYNAFLNHTTLSLEWPVTDVDQNTMIFRVPALKCISDPVAPGGIDEDVMEEINFTAQRDTVLNTMFMVDRFSSVLPFSAA